MAESQSRYFLWDGVPNVTDGAVDESANCKFLLLDAEQDYVPHSPQPRIPDQINTTSSHVVYIDADTRNKIVAARRDGRVRIKQVDYGFHPVEDVLTVGMRVRPVSSAKGKESSLLLRIYEYGGDEKTGHATEATTFVVHKEKLKLVYQEVLTGEQMRRMRTRDPRTGGDEFENPRADESRKKPLAGDAVKLERKYVVRAWVGTAADAFAGVTAQTSVEEIDKLKNVFGDRMESVNAASVAGLAGRAYTTVQGVNMTAAYRARTVETWTLPLALTSEPENAAPKAPIAITVKDVDTGASQTVTKAMKSNREVFEFTGQSKKTVYLQVSAAFTEKDEEGWILPATRVLWISRGKYDPVPLGISQGTIVSQLQQFEEVRFPLTSAGRSWSMWLYFDYRDRENPAGSYIIDVKDLGPGGSGMQLAYSVAELESAKRTLGSSDRQITVWGFIAGTRPTTIEVSVTFSEENTGRFKPNFHVVSGPPEWAGREAGARDGNWATELVDRRGDYSKPVRMKVGEGARWHLHIRHDRVAADEKPVAGARPPAGAASPEPETEAPVRPPPAETTHAFRLVANPAGVEAFELLAFEKDTGAPAAHTKDLLDRAACMLIEHGFESFEVGAYCDAGNAPDREAQAKKRAQALVDYLTKTGMQAGAEAHQRIREQELQEAAKQQDREGKTKYYDLQEKYSVPAADQARKIKLVAKAYPAGEPAPSKCVQTEPLQDMQFNMSGS